MVYIDTSALVAIAFDEEKSAACIRAIEAEPDILISAGTLAEALVVSARRSFAEAMNNLLDGFDFKIEPVTVASARRIGEASGQWARACTRRG